MKLFTIALGLLCLIFMSTEASFAKTTEAFNKRFQIIRDNNGKLIGIRDRTLPVKFSVSPYIKMIKSKILEEQKIISQSNFTDGAYDSLVKEILNDGKEDFLQAGGTPAEYENYATIIINSLKELATLNVENVFNSPLFKDVVSRYEERLTKAILLLDPTILANVEDPTFFYKRNVTYKVVSWALDFAKKRLSRIPLLNTASYVIVEVEKLITERRNFHQNMLLHYLENFNEKDLGLSHDEVNMLWSSIYESRIEWYAFWESNTAKANWMKYGMNNFYLNFRTGTGRMARSRNLYSEVNERINFSFQKVVLNNEKVIVNLFDNESMLQSTLPVAYNYDRPTLIARKRMLLTLAELGLSFVPLNTTIKDMAGSFIKSFYTAQKITEGALYGYFESIGEKHGMNTIKSQYQNPFDELSMK